MKKTGVLERLKAITQICHNIGRLSHLVPNKWMFVYIIFSLFRFILSAVEFDMVVENANNGGKKVKFIDIVNTTKHEVNASLLIICHALSIVH